MIAIETADMSPRSDALGLPWSRQQHLQDETPTFNIGHRKVGLMLHQGKPEADLYGSALFIPVRADKPVQFGGLWQKRCRNGWCWFIANPGGT